MAFLEFDSEGHVNLDTGEIVQYDPDTGEFLSAERIANVIDYDTSGSEESGHIKDIGSFEFGEGEIGEKGEDIFFEIATELGIDPSNVIIHSIYWNGDYYEVEAWADFSDSYEGGD